MKYILKLGLILMVYALIAGLLLGVVNHVTRPQIKKQKRKKQLSAKKAVIPEANFFEKDTINGLPFDKAYKSKEKGAVLGYIVKGQAKGYSSTVKLVVGLNKDFSIKNIEIVSQQETPGLGAKCENKGFKKQFENLSNPENIYVKKDNGKIAALTGATITSRAVSKAVRESIKKLRASLQSRGG